MTDYFSAGGQVYDQTDNDIWFRFAVIAYKNNRKQFVYSARRWSYYLVSSYICQLQRGPSVVQSYYILLKCVLLSRLFSREKFVSVKARFVVSIWQIDAFRPNLIAEHVDVNQSIDAIRSAAYAVVGCPPVHLPVRHVHAFCRNE